MKVHVKTLGCRLNQAESERIAQGFVLAGHDVTDSDVEADLIVLNSCTVTGRAGRESVRAARRRPGQRLVVTGCHSEVAPGRFADADLIVASADKDNLVALTAERLGTEGFALGADFREDASLAIYPLVLDATRAFVKIQDGCHLSCAFCLTTIARGDSRSRDADEIIDEVTRLARRGCSEVVLTGVHAGAYGREHGAMPDLGALIERILSETTIPRVRLSSLEPWTFRPEWLALWERWGERLCRHLHVSLQSGADSVLSRMRRAYRIESYERLIDAARAAIPRLAVTTDLIVGFPGESDAEHEESLRTVERLAFAGAHIFTFSPRPGTAAATMPDRIPGPIKKRRHHQMRAITDASAAAYRRSQLGSIQPILWEKPDADGVAHGLTDTYLRVSSRDPRARRNRLEALRLERLVDGKFEVAWPDRPQRDP